VILKTYIHIPVNLVACKPKDLSQIPMNFMVKEFEDRQPYLSELTSVKV